MTHFVGQNLSLVEPVFSPEIVSSSLGRIEFLGGGQSCLVFYRKAISATDGNAELQICGRVFVPLAAIPEIIDLLVRAATESGVVATAAQRLLM